MSFQPGINWKLEGEMCAEPDLPNLERLPKPVLKSHPEWGELYRAAWEMAYAHMRRGTRSDDPPLRVPVDPVKVIQAYLG